MTIKEQDKTHKIIIAGVGGQGAVTAARLIMVAAWLDDYHALQSEVHGMSQRGGSVNAHILIDRKPVKSPLVMEASCDLLIGLEPLETLRYLPYLRTEAAIVASDEPHVNIDDYPPHEAIIGDLNKIPNTKIIGTATHAKTLGNPRSANLVLLGQAANYLPIREKMWEDSIKRCFETKGDAVIKANIEAFHFGQKL